MGHKDRIIAFDADGVLFDSNNFKKSNICKMLGNTKKSKVEGLSDAQIQTLLVSILFS